MNKRFPYFFKAQAGNENHLRILNEFKSDN